MIRSAPLTARVYQAVGSWAAVRSSKQVVCRPHLHCAQESQSCDLRAERGSERPVIHFESIWVNCSFVNLGLFPVSEVHKLIQNFLQSSEPPLEPA